MRNERNHEKRLANRRAKAQASATPRQLDELARRQAMGIAIVEKPLRFLRSRMYGDFRLELAIDAAKKGLRWHVRNVAIRVVNGVQP